MVRAQVAVSNRNPGQKAGVFCLKRHCWARNGASGKASSGGFVAEAAFARQPGGKSEPKSPSTRFPSNWKVLVKLLKLIKLITLVSLVNLLALINLINLIKLLSLLGRNNTDCFSPSKPIRLTRPTRPTRLTKPTRLSKTLQIQQNNRIPLANQMRLLLLEFQDQFFIDSGCLVFSRTSLHRALSVLTLLLEETASLIGRLTNLSFIMLVRTAVFPAMAA